MGLRPHEFSARFWSVVAATFLGFLGMGSVLPVLGPHIRRDLGGSDATVGFVIGIFSWVALLGRFASGPLADRRGRKPAFMAGLAACAAAGVIYLLPLGLPGAYAARILQGFGEACLYTGAAAWAIELGGIERSGQALGYLSSGIWGGISVGPMVGQWLGTFPRAAALQAVAALLAIAVLWFVPEHYQAAPHEKKRQWIPDGIWLPGLAIGFVNVHYPVVAGFLVLHLANYGNTGPAAFTAYAMVILCSRFFLGSLPDRVPPIYTFYTGLGFMFIGLSALAIGPPPMLAVLTTAVLGFGFSFPWASIAATVLRRTPEAQRGSVVGVLSAFYDCFVGISSFSAGIVAKRYGYSAAFAMAAGAILIAALVGRGVFRGSTPPVEQPEEVLQEA